MSRVSALQSDDMLVNALKENPFDIVGLAELPPDEDGETLKRCFRSLGDIVCGQQDARSRDTFLLAQVLFGMVTVAQKDYADHGKQEYWSFLGKRIQGAVTADRRKIFVAERLDQRSQQRLGEWFREALDAFQYGIPPVGPTHIGPIVFHAGVPKSSLPGVLKVIESACVTYGPEAISLPFRVRKQMVEERRAKMAARAFDLFSSRLRGAEELWTCLARVVHAFIAGRDYCLELKRLPPRIDPAAVRDVLREQAQPLDRNRRTLPSRHQLPTVTFNLETGEVRFRPPHGAPEDWHVQSDEHINLCWTHTPRFCSAEFRQPLPLSLAIGSSQVTLGSNGDLKTRPEKWAGYWFHADNGEVLDGDEIDTNGVPPGRWIVVFEGTPISCSVTPLRQVRLQWGWLDNSTRWTAWEIDVPPRTATQGTIVWNSGTKESSVILQRRPDTRIDITGDVVCTAQTDDGREVALYATPPRISNPLSRPVELLLTVDEAEQKSVPQDLTLAAGEKIQLPLTEAGVYQIAHRAKGRPLLRFAFIPELQVEGPVVDHSSGTACICIHAGQYPGRLLTTDGCAVPVSRGWYSHEFLSTEPIAEVALQSATTNLQTLTLRWPIEDVRWKVLGLSPDLAVWTRESVVISPHRIDSSDIQIEIQHPSGTKLLVNGKEPPLTSQATPSGTVCRLPLRALRNDSSDGIAGLLLNVDGVAYPAVTLCKRPVLTSFAAVIDDSKIEVNWTASQQLTNCSIVVWDACVAQTTPVFIPLSDGALQSGRAELPNDILPQATYLAISLARAIMPADVVYYHFAASGPDESAPQGVCVCRSSRTVLSAGDQVHSWESFLFQAILRRHFGIEGFESWLVQSLRPLHSRGGFLVSEVLQLRKDLDDGCSIRRWTRRDLVWVELLQAALLRNIQCVTSETIRRSFRSDQPELLDQLIDLGVPAGHAFSSSPLPCSVVDHPVYPVQYISDLQLVSWDDRLASSENDSSIPSREQFRRLKEQAAERILKFHRQHELPSPTLFLPLSGQTATIEKSDHGHRHVFHLPSPALHADSAIAERFKEMLGILPWALDCEGPEGTPTRTTSATQRNHTTQRSLYSLYWNSDDYAWQVERLKTKSPFCCYADFRSMIAPAWTKSRIRKLALRNLLSRFAQGCAEPPHEGFACLESLTPKLMQSYFDYSFNIHEEILSPANGDAPIQKKKLESAGVAVRSGVYEVCWQIAWIERYTAHFGTKGLFPNKRPTIGDFQISLARSLKMWPALMRRCLALAELLIWTLDLGGLGVSVKFEPSAIPNQSSSNAVVDLQNAKSDNSPIGAVRSNVDGLVIDWTDGVATVLLPQENVALKDARRDRRKRLYATFRWSDLTPADREYVESERKVPEEPERGTGVPLSEVLITKKVICDLKKSDEWKIVSVRLDRR